MIAEISDDGPWIENFRTAKAVTVIPFAKLLILFGGAVVCRHLSDFGGGEAEVLAVPLIQNRVYFQIVQTTKNTFLRDTQNTAQKTVVYMRIIFQTAGKQVAHKVYDRFIKSVHVALLNRCIIFVNDDDGGCAIVFMQQQSQRAQGHLIVNFVCGLRS